MPANAVLLFRSVVGCEAGTTAGIVGSRTIKTPELAAGGMVWAGFVERGATVVLGSNLEILIKIDLGRVAEIGSTAA